MIEGSSERGDRELKANTRSEGARKDSDVARTLWGADHERMKEPGQPRRCWTWSASYELAEESIGS